MNDAIRLDKARWWLLSALALAVIIYVSSMSWRSLTLDFLDLRWEIIVLSGVFTWVMLTLCMMFPLRWGWMNALVGGVDKGYGIHKWLGVSVVLIITVHWLAVQSWRWLARYSLLESYGAEGLLADILGRLGFGGTFPLDAFSRIGGGGAFFIMFFVVAVALIQRIPYHIFWAVHKAAPVIYLLGSIHVLNRIPTAWWRTPAAYILSCLTLMGIYGAIVSLSQSIGRKRQFPAKVVSVNLNSEDIIDVTLQVDSTFEHKPGQFAFVDFTRQNHGSHPFSMVSFDPHRIRFLIKKLGDATGLLDKFLEPGQEVTLEGPYGRFNFASHQPVQVWIAGGIGITPFISRLEQLASGNNSKQTVHLWYTVSTMEEAAFPEHLQNLCDRAGVRLHMVVSERGDDDLSPEDILQEAGNMAHCSVWFCGPNGLGATMEKELKKKGLSGRNFHTEHFDLR